MYLVRVGAKETLKERLAWLESHGYENVGRIDERYPYGVIDINYGYFHGLNVTCLAASASAGNFPISWEEFLTIHERIKKYF